MVPSAIVIGGGGHGAVVVATLRLAGQTVLGFVDPSPDPDRARRLAVPRLGDDSALANFPPGSVVLANGLGSINGTIRRSSRYEDLAAVGYGFIDVRHPTSNIADDAVLAPGTQVMAGAIVQTGCLIGENVLINTGVIVEHDCQIEAHAHIASGAVLAGGVQVGRGAHVGCGAVVMQGVIIGAGAVIGAGTVVISEVTAGATVVGNPGRCRP